MLLTRRLVFVHIPCTGGMWVRRVIAASGVPYVEGDYHLTARQVLPVAGDRYSFTFVRHPVTWWRSLWAHAAAAGGQFPSLADPSRDPFRPIARIGIGDSYAAFMTRVLDQLPGEYSRIAACYTDGVTAAGRTEDLAADLDGFCAAAGQPLPVYPALPLVNRGSYGPAAGSTPEIDAEITRAEAQLIHYVLPGSQRKGGDLNEQQGPVGRADVPERPGRDP